MHNIKKMPLQNKHIQKWEAKNEFKERLFELILKHKNSIVVLSYMTNELLGKGNTVAAIDELYLFLTNMTAIE